MIQPVVIYLQPVDGEKRLRRFKQGVFVYFERGKCVTLQRIEETVNKRLKLSLLSLWLKRFTLCLPIKLLRDLSGLI